MIPNTSCAPDRSSLPPEPAHRPVLLKEAMRYLCPSSSHLYLDATVGLGGHAEAILDACSPAGRLIALDQDAEALRLASERLAPFGERVTFLHGNFSEMERLLEALQVEGVDGVLMDLGMSSYQLDVSGRGFSFLRDEPLDMRMNPETGRRASHVLNEYDEKALEWVFRVYGEERWARRFARAVVQARHRQPIQTSGQLAALIASVTPAPKGPVRHRIHPATRVFQALRIAVNDELRHLEAGLQAALNLLNLEGTLCVISFHSLEDRIVKHTFRRVAQPFQTPPRFSMPDFEILTKKPVTANDEELANNPRSRSAKLRAIRRASVGFLAVQRHEKMSL